MQPHWRIGHRPPGGCTRLWHTCQPYLRFAAAVCLLAVLAAACTDLVPALEATVQQSISNLREGPGPMHPVATRVVHGTRLPVRGRDDDGEWIQVIHEDRTLWIHVNHTNLTAALRDSLPVAAFPTALPETTPVPPTPVTIVLTVTGAVVNVRIGPGTDYPVRTQVRQGDPLQAQALNAAGDWVRISDPTGGAIPLWIYGPLTDLAEHHRAVLPMVAGPPKPSPPTPVPTAPPTVDPGVPCPLVWSDEFERDGLPDSSRWWFDTRQNDWNPDALFYTTANRKANARVKDGRLILEAHKDGYGGREYTVPRLTSIQAWTYGWFEMAARLPAGRGTKAAIWMVSNTDPYGGWPNNGEIDIMEFVGHKPGIVHANIHTAVYSNRAGTETLDAQTLHFPDASTAFHRYAVEWTESAITIYADDTPYFVFKNDRMWNPEADYKEWPFDHPFRLILNLYVGGDWAAAKGIDPSIWPQSMELEYVRVYACKP